MIVAVAKLKETATGDTLCDERNPILYDPLEPMPPVISYAVSAKKAMRKNCFPQSPVCLMKTLPCS